MDAAFLRSEASCGRNLDDLIESLGASEASSMEASPLEQNVEELEEEAAADGGKAKELLPEEANTPAKEDRSQDEMEEEEEEDLMPSLEESSERNVEDVRQVEPLSGLRRRNRPE